VFYVTNERHGLDDSGRYWLRGNTHDRIILRGINLPLLDNWEFPANQPIGKLDELAKTGANTVRIQWYASYPGRPPYSATDLDRVIEACRTRRLVPIIELHDYTCQDDPNLVNAQLMTWWTRSDVTAVLKKHERYLIINLANELGSYRWSGSPATALNNYANAYKTAISTIRNTGLRMPIMIDAPDCGTSVNAFLSVGQQFIDHDPQHNILLSAHAYWGSDYDGSADLDLAIKAKLPIVLGEIANKQFANGDECYYGIDGTNINHPPPTRFSYKNLLIDCTVWEIGWLAWSWGPDKCAERQLAHNGSYTDLTDYGRDILDQATYGLRRGLYGPQKTNDLPGAPPT
jgi:mannan endo-1,4-beta-mannosidase